MLNHIFDSHAHYDDSRFDGDRDAVLESLPEKGISAVLNAGCNLETTRSGLALAEKYAFFYASAGIHPADIAGRPADYLDELARLSSHPKAVAIGEIGLDYHYDDAPHEVQLAGFEEQLGLARDLDLPVIIHSREATEDTLHLLRKYRPRGIVHCYSGSAQTAKEILALGMYIGFTGVVTFKNARRALEALSVIPLERLLVETDCPYMAPEPYRGKRCDSSMIIHTASAMAMAKGIHPQVLLDTACQNACDVYGISRSALAID